MTMWVVALVDSSGGMPAAASVAQTSRATFQKLVSVSNFAFYQGNFKVASHILSYFQRFQFQICKVGNSWNGCHSESGRRSKGVKKINSAKNKDRVEASYLPSTSINGFLKGGEK